MAKVVKHPEDDGKWMLSDDLVNLYGEAYGHGRGNGKSKQAVYKWIRRRDQDAEPLSGDPDTQPATSVDDVDSSNDEDGWIEVDWRNPPPDSSGMVDENPDTINPAVRGLLGGSGRMSVNLAKKQAELQGRVARYGFVAADRLISWWGKGVTNNPDYELRRSKADLDLLEETTVDVMEYYGLEIPVNPLMIWGITVGAAYVPPVIEIRKKADPNRIKRGGLLRFIPFFGRRYRNVRAVRREVDDTDAGSGTSSEA